MSLRVAIKVQGVRAATDEEIEARSLGGSPLSVMGSGMGSGIGSGIGSGGKPHQHPLH